MIQKRQVFPNFNAVPAAEASLNCYVCIRTRRSSAIADLRHFIYTVEPDLMRSVEAIVFCFKRNIYRLLIELHSAPLSLGRYDMTR